MGEERQWYFPSENGPTLVLILIGLSTGIILLPSVPRHLCQAVVPHLPSFIP